MVHGPPFAPAFRSAGGYGGPPPPLGPESDTRTLRRLQLVIGRKLDGLLHGEYLGLLPGAGSDAAESREYRPGDDVRRMDWPVTARTTVPHVRQTVADRELEAWLCVDLSPSLDFGTASCQKRDVAIAAAAAIIELVVRGGSRAGAVVTNGAGTSVLPARGGRAGAFGLLRRIAHTPRAAVGNAAKLAGDSVELGSAIAMLNRPPRRRGLAVLVSDFLAPDGWQRPLRVLGTRHDVLAVEVVDPRELSLPNVGLLALTDPESGEEMVVQTADAELREEYRRAAAEQRAQIARSLRSAGAAHLRLSTDSDWLLDIVRFVAERRRRGLNTTPRGGLRSTAGGGGR